MSKKDNSNNQDDIHDDEPVLDSAATNQPTELNEYELQIQQLTDSLQRERADATNIRRRHQQEIDGLRSRLKSGVISDLLPVIDNFERALKHAPADLVDHDYIKGVQRVVKQFEDTLVGMGVERIKTVGEPFDPSYHQAVSMDEGEGDLEIVSDELQAGYKIGDDVIRHAMVRVTTK